MTDLQKIRLSAGFTMVEVIIVILIFAILATAMMISVPGYLSKRRDDQRKADLHNMKVAFEDYNNDKSCYPPEQLIRSCGSKDIAPYLKFVPCDPSTKQPYSYTRTADCQGYQLYAVLENPDDADVETLGCEQGCGPDGAFNYGVVGGTSLLERRSQE
jgi:prepilin-type N-terminal cleavage/methylation domain-containing protein